MLRTVFIRLIAALLIVSALAHLTASAALAQSAQDIQARNDQTVQLYNQGKYAEALKLAEQTLALAERALGPEHPETLLSVNNLGFLYQAQGRYSEAEPLYRWALAGYEKAQGMDHPYTLASVNNLGALYAAQGRYAEAESLYQRALAGSEKALGPEHPDTLLSVSSLGFLYATQGRYGEAEPLYKRALVGREKVLGPEHSDTLTSVNNLGSLYQTQGRYAEAEPLLKRALAGIEKILGTEHPNTLSSLTNLAILYHKQGRHNEAEPLYQRALAGSEKVLGLEHPDTLGSVSNLAALYDTQGRYGEAEPLYRRALAGKEKVLGPEHPDTLLSVTNLATLYYTQGRYNEVERLLKRVLAGREKALGSEHPDTLGSASNLGFLYSAQGRYGEAEPLLKRALAGREKALGLEHPDTLFSVTNLAVLYYTQGRYSEAEPLLKHALAGREKALGSEHPDTLWSVNNLAFLYFAQHDWREAAQYWRRSTAAITKRVQRGALDAGLTGKKKSDAEQLDWQFGSLVKAAYRLAPESRSPEPAISAEMFLTAQWALSSEAAQSLAQMALRGAKGDPALSVLVRERQDLVDEWQRREQIQAAALGQDAPRRDAKAEAENRARMTEIDRRIAEIDAKLKDKFPDYAILASPTPVAVEDVQAQLGADEALVLFLDTPQAGPTSEETFIWVATKTEMRWVRSDLGKAALTREVQALRCGLDEEEWGTPTQQNLCIERLGLSKELPDPSRPLPFDLGKAYALYKALFGEVEDLIKGKRLLIVPSGPLTSLPFHVLVTEKPAVALPDKFEGYRNVAWLGRRNAITTLPAVSSLKALRGSGSNRLKAAADEYAGYGHPLLKGDGVSCRAPKAPDECPSIEVAKRQSVPAAVDTGRATVRGFGGRRSANANTDEVFAKGATSEAVLQQVRSLCSLPDTAYEIKCVSERFKEKGRLIRLEAEAKETDIKALSAGGKLANYGVLHFATHGLLSGDVERMAQRQGEPALVLTPPDKPTDAYDDGLLMASEVAALKLNADWVVLSACNTAAGDKIGAQALSGLARAFFYAGARALLVSHWPVYSDAAVRLTTRAFAELERNPKAGRAEALQQAMVALMDDASQTDNAHPAVWAPFVVVGEGAR